MKRTFLSLTLAAVLACFGVGRSALGSLTIALDTPFPENSSSQKPAPDGSPPWLTAVFEQAGSNLVQLTLSANLSSNNDVRGGQGGGPVSWGWGFNFNPAKTLTDLNFVYVSGNQASKIETSLDGYKPDGLGSVFDILFGWENSSSLSGTETAVYNLSLTGGSLVEDDFNFLSNPIVSGNDGTYVSAAHIQNITSSPGSTWIGGFEQTAVPEASSLIVWGSIALTGLCLCRRKLFA